MTPHRHPHGHPPEPVTCAVITVSDTRTEGTDLSGRLIRDLLTASGHRVAMNRIVPDEPSLVTQALLESLALDEVGAVILNGGTGISKRDRTHEAVAAVLERRLDGFGEIFRALSYAEIGPAAILSRAIAGIARGRAVFAVPGSPAAVRLAMEKLILPELSHVVGEAGKG